MTERRGPSRGWRWRAAFGVLVVAFCTAPTPGDIGGCGQPVQELSAIAFFEEKKLVDCGRCQECGLSTRACRAACDDGRPPLRAFPERCLPLVHDGEVCLRALGVASCGDYADYVRDEAPLAPTECDFCPGEAP